MLRDLSVLESIIRNRVCGVCSDRTVDGQCGMENPDTCSLFSLFPEVARAVMATDSDDIRDYISAIREHVCSLCGQQQLDGSCDPREQVRCALDAYLMIVVDAIEEATGKTFDRSRVSGSPAVPLSH